MNKVEHEDPTADKDIEKLMAFVSSREHPPAATAERVRRAVMETFDELPEPQHRRPSRLMAVSTALAAALALMYLLQSSLPEVISAGEIQFSQGTFSVQSLDGSVADTSLVAPGSTIQTDSDSRLLLQLEERSALRADAQTRFTLISSTEIQLHQGRIYLDNANSQPLKVVTRYGTVTDIGTQFEVASLGQQLTVALRQGAIDLTVGDQQLHSAAQTGQGELLRFTGTNLTQRSPIAATDDHWQWIHRARPGFKLADRSVADYLNWAARESGWTLRYQSDLVRQQTRMPKALQGNATVDADLASIEQVLRTTRFELAPDSSDQLLIRFRAM